MLVRRDVQAFEQSCAAVDPDAVAAFKTLLAVKPPVAKAPAPGAVVPKEVKAAPAAPAPAQAAIPVAPPAPHEAVANHVNERPAEAERKPVKHEATAVISDERWLDAVRGALVAHHPEAAEPAERTAISAPPAWPAQPAPNPAAPKSAAKPAPAIADLTPPAQPAAPAPMPVAPIERNDAALAPALPPPANVSSVAMPPAEINHPVPPGSIPDATVLDDATLAKAEPRGGARGGWLTHIPLLGRALGH
jgi:hypothetical protein